VTKTARSAANVRRANCLISLPANVNVPPLVTAVPPKFSDRASAFRPLVVFQTFPSPGMLVTS